MSQNQVQQNVRESAVREGEDDTPTVTALLYRIEREVVPVLRRVRELVNLILSGFGTTVDITFADSPYTMANDVEFVRADATGGNITLNMPAAADTDIRILSVKKTDSTGNAVIVTANGTEDLDGGPTAPVTIGQTFLRFIPRGGGYDIA